MTTVAITGNELQDGDLATLVLRADTADRQGLGATGVFGEEQKLLAYTLMRSVLADAGNTGELFEVSAPIFWNTLRRD